MVLVGPNLFQWPTGLLQCFNTAGLVIWPVKIVPKMTYKVPSGTLNLYLLTIPFNWPISFELHFRNPAISPFRPQPEPKSGITLQQTPAQTSTLHFEKSLRSPLATVITTSCALTAGCCAAREAWTREITSTQEVSVSTRYARFIIYDASFATNQLYNIYKRHSMQHATTTKCSRSCHKTVVVLVARLYGHTQTVQGATIQ